MPRRHALLALLLPSLLPTLASGADGPSLAAAMDLPVEDVESALETAAPEMSRVVSSLGPITPTSGATMTFLSTGYASLVTDGEDYDRMTTGVDPTEPSSPVFDPSLLEVTLRVPQDMHSLQFDWTFLSREYPIYVGSLYNDRFTVIQTGALFSGNIVFDDAGSVVDVNSALFSVTDAISLDGTGFWRPGGQPPTNHDGGSTGWVTTTTPVQPGELLTLRFDVHDVGDGVYDSGVLVDNMRWSEEEVEDPSSGAPTELHWLSPKVGPTSGGTEVILSGRNFAGGMTVSIGGVVLDASAVTILDSETARIVVPAAPDGQSALAEVYVENGTRAARLVGGWTWADRTPAGALPTLLEAEPLFASAEGGDEVTLRYQGGSAMPAVWFGDVQVIPDEVEPGVLLAEVPAGEPGAIVLRVTDGAGRSDGAPLPFVLRGEDDAVPSGVSPVRGCSASGDGSVSLLALALLPLLLLRRRSADEESEVHPLPQSRSLLFLALPLLLAGCSDAGLHRVEVRPPVAYAAIESIVEEVVDETARVSALVPVGSVVQVSGEESSGFGGTVLEGEWSIVQAPSGSSAVLQRLGQEGLRAQLVPDVPGTYLVQLVVRDHRGLRSHPEALVIEAVSGTALEASLIWATGGADLDLHLLGPNGAYFGEGDCFFGNPGPAWGDPDLTADDPNHPVDADGTGAGPYQERVVLPAPPPGTYTVLVHHLNDRDTANEVSATLSLWIGGEPVSLPLEPESLVQDEVWRAFAVQLPSGAVSPVDEVVTHESLGGPVLNGRMTIAP